MNDWFIYIPSLGWNLLESTEVFSRQKRSFQADHSVLRLLQISQQHIESQLVPWRKMFCLFLLQIVFLKFVAILQKRDLKTLRNNCEKTHVYRCVLRTVYAMNASFGRTDEFPPGMSAEPRSFHQRPPATRKWWISVHNSLCNWPSH